MAHEFWDGLKSHLYGLKGYGHSDNIRNYMINDQATFFIDPSYEALEKGLGVLDYFRIKLSL